MQIIKICEFCKQEFIARTTVTQCCSDACAKRFYKLKKRNEAIRQAKIETAVKQKPEAYITEDQVKVIQAKEWLSLKEAALLLNVTPLTLRRWTLAGKVKSEKLGRKHMFGRVELLKNTIPLK
jgi:excisionase family DNA binding protein